MGTGDQAPFVISNLTGMPSSTRAQPPPRPETSIGLSASLRAVDHPSSPPSRVAHDVDVRPSLVAGCASGMPTSRRKIVRGRRLQATQPRRNTGQDTTSQIPPARRGTHSSTSRWTPPRPPGFSQDAALLTAATCREAALVGRRRHFASDCGPMPLQRAVEAVRWRDSHATSRLAWNRRRAPRHSA